MAVDPFPQYPSGPPPVKSNALEWPRLPRWADRHRGPEQERPEVTDDTALPARPWDGDVLPTPLPPNPPAAEYHSYGFLNYGLHSHPQPTYTTTYEVVTNPWPAPWFVPQPASDWTPRMCAHMRPDGQRCIQPPSGPSSFCASHCCPICHYGKPSAAPTCPACAASRGASAPAAPPPPPHP
eukprot:EG_transcript_35093